MTDSEYKHGQSAKTDQSLTEDKTALLAKILKEINSAYADTVKMHSESHGKDLYQEGRATE